MASVADGYQPFYTAMEDTKIFCWLLDVLPLWPTSTAENEASQNTSQWVNSGAAQRALALLPDHERAKTLRFYRVSDAKLCLGSYLLKHRAIAEICGVPWSEAVISQDSNQKPCYKPVDTDQKTLEFNVSHHGTLVALVGCPGEAVKLGVDIAQMNWEKDYPAVMRDGFEAWANIYEMVFSDQELQDIAGFVPPTQGKPEDEIRAKLRHFYAHWCLKEAYVKMTGEALLASWLKDLEFRKVKVPMSVQQLNAASNPASDWGEACSDVEIWFHGKRVTDVKLEIQAFREDYMIATASSSVKVPLTAFKEVDIEQDIYP